MGRVSCSFGGISLCRQVVLVLLHLVFIMFVSCSSTPSQSDEAKQALEKFDVKVIS